MKATNPLQLLACAVLFSLALALLFAVLALGTRQTPTANPSGLSARMAAVERLNGEIAGQR